VTKLSSKKNLKICDQKVTKLCSEKIKKICDKKVTKLCSKKICMFGAMQEKHHEPTPQSVKKSGAWSLRVVESPKGPARGLTRHPKKIPTGEFFLESPERTDDRV
jgi:hypothetical protein